MLTSFLVDTGKCDAAVPILQADAICRFALELAARAQ